MDYKGFTLKMTCGACPELYDVSLNGTYVGYMRLRHGYFNCTVGINGISVYGANPTDESDGCFVTQEQREFHLNAAVDAIIKHYIKLNLLKIVGCCDCKHESYMWIDADDFKPCPECSPYNSKFHYIKEMKPKPYFKYENNQKVSFDNGAISGKGKIVGVATDSQAVIGATFMIEVEESSIIIPNEEYPFHVIPMCEVHIKN